MIMNQGTKYPHKDILTEVAQDKSGNQVVVGSGVLGRDEKYGIYVGHVEKLYERVYDGLSPSNGGAGPWAEIRVTWTKSGALPERALTVEVKHVQRFSLHQVLSSR